MPHHETPTSCQTSPTLVAARPLRPQARAQSWLQRRWRGQTLQSHQSTSPAALRAHRALLEGWELAQQV